VRAYAMLDLPPADVLRNASELAASMPGQQFVTCVYAVHDPADGTLTYANAGHPAPALLTADGRVTVLGERLGLPLTLGREFRQREVAFPAGSSIALFTDGLVEQRKRPLEQGVDDLGEALRGIADTAVEALEAACDKLVRDVTGGRYDDDVALLYARNVDEARRASVMPLDAAPDIAARARRFVRDTVASWQLDGASDVAATVATELVTNAVRHAQGAVRLRLHHTGGRLIVDVADTDQRLPRRFEPAPDEERHRGLFMVDAFSRRWGTRPTPDGKVVWAELAVPVPA
jgi:anti-sigma regulatory factor (Ser/Thr protein kinase)